MVHDNYLSPRGYKIKLPQGLHIDLSIGKTPEIEMHSLLLQVAQTINVFLIQGNMIAYLALALTEMNIADVEKSEFQSAEVRSFCVPAGRKQKEYVRSSFGQFQIGHLICGVLDLGKQDTHPGRHSQAQQFLPQFIFCQLIIGHQQGPGIGVREPGFNNLSMDQAVVYSNPQPLLTHWLFFA